MTDNLTMVFTGVIAVATVVYVVFSFKLWQQTRISADATRETAEATHSSVKIASLVFLIDLLTRMQDDINRAKQTGQPQADIVASERFRDMFAEMVFGALGKQIDVEADGELRENLGKFQGFFLAHGIDPNRVPGFASFFRNVGS